MQLTLPESLLTPQLDRLFEALSPYENRLVGGVVRDLILGVESADVDICTTATPEQVMERLNIKQINYAPTGIEHGTLTAHFNSGTYEITTARKDVSTDGRHAEVAYTTDFEEDAKRRDFTFNALYMDLEGNVTDYFGGIDDLQNGVVRFIGNPDDRIQEDYLRIMRFFRFYARYGTASPDEETLRALVRHGAKLKTLSPERITKEWLSLLKLDNPLFALAMMETTGIADHLELTPFDTAPLEKFIQFFKKVDTTPENRWACLQWGAESADVMLENPHIRLSNKQRDHIQALFDVRTVELDPDHPEYTAYWHNVQALAVRYALDACHGNRKMEGTREQIDLLLSLELPQFPVEATAVMKLGIPEGPFVGELLDRLEKWWVDNQFPGRRACLIKLEEMAKELQKREAAKPTGKSENT